MGTKDRLDAADPDMRRQIRKDANIWQRLRKRIKRQLAEGKITKADASRMRQEERERTRLRHKRWKSLTRDKGERERDKSKQFFGAIRSKYGLTAKQYLRMLVNQGSRCASCARELVLFSSDRSSAPVVDHCHATGRVRGLLCQRCNILVGRVEAEHSTEDYEKAKLYLRRPRHSESEGPGEA